MFKNAFAPPRFTKVSEGFRSAQDSWDGEGEAYLGT